jgi:hypothetical protein
VRVQNGAPCTPYLSSKPGAGKNSELDPCLAWVRWEQKAAAKVARFGAHFTQIIVFSVQSAFRRLTVKEDIDTLLEDLATLKLVQKACSADATTADDDQWLEAASVRVEATELETHDRHKITEWLGQLQSETASDYQTMNSLGKTYTTRTRIRLSRHAHFPLTLLHLLPLPGHCTLESSRSEANSIGGRIPVGSSFWTTRPALYRTITTDRHRCFSAPYCCRTPTFQPILQDA